LLANPHPALAIFETGQGTHGTDSTDAAKSLIEQGIRRAIREGFLDKDDVRIVHEVDR
jgi:hypothetical protein